MSDVIRLRAVAEIEEEAAAWVWRLDADTVSSQDKNAFEQWIRQDARHRRAFEELGGVWRALDGLAEAKRDEKIATFVAEHQRVSRPLYPAPQDSRKGLKFLPWALAATVLIAIGLFSWLQRGNEAQTLATAVGQQRTVTLADSSTVYLNTNTILETRFVREQRVIHLLKGEALFKVAHDRERPFFVHAGSTVVRAVGTEFNVRMRDARDIEVIVAEGRVEVESKVDRKPEGITPTQNLPTTTTRVKRTLDAGQRFDTAAEAARIVAMNTEVLSNALAWRDGAIVFDGEPLSDAIAELNRYTDTRFVVTDPHVRDLRVGGRFKAGDVDEFLDALKKALPVSARRTTDNLVYIEPRP